MMRMLSTAARFAAALLAGMAAFGTAPAAEAQQKPEQMTVSLVTSPFNVPSIVMDRMGLLKEAMAPLGVAVQSPEITSGAKQVQALAAGALDIASVLGGTSAILGRANGADITVVARYSSSPEAFTIMSMPGGPKTVADLKGKRVAGPKGTTLHQLLVAALASAGMTVDDVSFISMDIPAARAALQAGSVDAALLAGNNALVVEQAGGGAFVTGKGLIAPTTVVAVRRDFLERHPALVEAYLGAHRRALDFVANRRTEALRLAAEDQKISMADAERMMGWYDFSSVIAERDIASLEADQDFMLANGMLTRRIDIRRDLIHPMAMGAR